MLGIFGSLWWIVALLLMIALLVAFHELGHYLVARRFGMGVKEFAIGFGPRLFVWMRKDYALDSGELEQTEFTVRAFPLGGFVQIKGMVPDEEASEVHTPGGFYSKPAWQRFLVLFAGPVFSFILGVILLGGIWMTVGVPAPSKKPIIGALATAGPAYLAGMRPGDRVMTVDGKPIQGFYDMVLLVRASEGRTLNFAIDRQGETQHLFVKPILDAKPEPKIDETLEPTEVRERQYRIKVSPQETKRAIPPVEAMSKAAIMPFLAVRNFGELLLKPSQLKDNVSGPIGIGEATKKASSSGYDLVYLAGLLSISLGVMNLLCVPPLDGGQMLFALVEMVRRKRASLRTQATVTFAGVVMMMLLTVTVLVIDVQRISNRKIEIATER